MPRNKRKKLKVIIFLSQKNGNDEGFQFSIKDQAQMRAAKATYACTIFVLIQIFFLANKMATLVHYVMFSLFVVIKNNFEFF